MKITTSSEFLTLSELAKLHDTNLNVCPIDSVFNDLTINPQAKVHSRRKLELNEDDLLQYFNSKGYSTHAMALNRQQQPVLHLMPYNNSEAADFATLLKAQLTKFIKKQYPKAAGVLFHFDEPIANAHVFFFDYNATDNATYSYQPHLKSNTNNDDNKQQTQEAKAKQQQEQLQQQLRQLRQRQVQIAIKIAEDKKKKRREKLRQQRIRDRRRRQKQQDGPDF